MSEQSHVNQHEAPSSQLETPAKESEQVLSASPPPFQLTASGEGSPNTGQGGDVIQRKEIETDFGKFRTDKFEKNGTRKLDIVLKFDPDVEDVNATKIGLTQSVKNDFVGTTEAIDPTNDGRRVKEGDGEGYYIDRVSDKNTPIYGSADLGADEGLKDTKQDNKVGGGAMDLGTNATYELGHAYKEGDTQKKKEAGLFDGPSTIPQDGSAKTFETTALALDGDQKGKYYGSVKWGLTYSTAKGLEIDDITLASKGDPTANFTEAAKLWNASTSRGSLEIIADPATVRESDFSTETTLAKGKKLTQKGTVIWGKHPAQKCELLKEDGTGSGKIYYVKNADLKDSGDGAATKDLPIPGA